MRIALSGGNGFQSSSVSVWRALHGDGGGRLPAGKGSVAKPAKPGLWWHSSGLGRLWADLRRPQRSTGQGRQEAEFKGKREEVMPSGFILLSGLQGGTFIINILAVSLGQSLELSQVSVSKSLDLIPHYICVMPDKACSHYLIWSWKQSSEGGRAGIIFPFYKWKHL